MKTIANNHYKTYLFSNFPRPHYYLNFLVFFHLSTTVTSKAIKHQSQLVDGVRSRFLDPCCDARNLPGNPFPQFLLPCVQLGDVQGISLKVQPSHEGLSPQQTTRQKCHVSRIKSHRQSNHEKALHRLPTES